jgi:hypothetical protein
MVDYSELTEPEKLVAGVLVGRRPKSLLRVLSSEQQVAAWMALREKGYLEPGLVDPAVGARS